MTSSRNLIVGAIVIVVLSVTSPQAVFMAGKVRTPQ
jgi:hypothetical protein